MRYPQFLKKGDKIVLTALSNGVKKNDIERKEKYLKAIDNIKARGYKVEMQEHCLKYRMFRSASAKVRGNKFNEAYFDKDSKMILNVAGGDFQYETLPYIDYKKIKEAPVKFVQGYSDTTFLTFLLTTICDIATVYGNGLTEFSYNEFSKSALNNFNLLEGKSLEQHSYDYYKEEKNEDDIFALPNCTEKVEWKSLNNKDKVEIKGRLIGGCQDIINSLVGTKYDKVKKFLYKYRNDGIVWYLETFSMESAAFMRSLEQLRNAGYFKYCKGIVFGRPFVYNRKFIDIPYNKAINKVLGRLNVPILYDADIGHVKPMITLVNGSITTFKYNKGKCEIVSKMEE